LEAWLNLLVVHGNAVAGLANCQLKCRYVLDRREERVGRWIVKRPQVGSCILELVGRWASQLTVQLLEMIVLSLRIPDLELAYRIKIEEWRASEIGDAGLDECLGSA
jgi:hypothetical protein